MSTVPTTPGFYFGFLLGRVIILPVHKKEGTARKGVSSELKSDGKEWREKTH